MSPTTAMPATIRSRPFWAALSWVTPSLAVVGLIGSRGRSRFYFAVISILALFLSMGVHEPMNRPYLWLVQNVPFSGSFAARGSNSGCCQRLDSPFLADLRVPVLATGLQRVASLARFKWFKVAAGRGPTGDRRGGRQPGSTPTR